MWKRLYLESCYISCKNGKYSGSIIEESVIVCDEIIEEETKAVTTHFNEKMKFLKQKTSVFYLHFYKLL